MRVPLPTRIAVYNRDGGRCARCRVPCEDISSSLHHRLPRRMGGTRNPLSPDPRNLVLLCGTGTKGCHGHVEANRSESYDDGWLIRSYDDLDQPLVALNGDLIHLTADGGRTDTWPTLAKLRERA